MITISNGINVRVVSTGAFETIYKKKGYHIVGDNKPAETKVVEITEEEVVTNEESTESESIEPEVAEDVEPEWITELLEKPISQWTKDETASFAREKGIDTSSARKLGEAKDIIKNWLDEQSK